MNKTQRASLTVTCPECGARVGMRCVGADGFSHVERYKRANRIGRTLDKGDPFR